MSDRIGAQRIANMSNAEFEELYDSLKKENPSMKKLIRKAQSMKPPRRPRGEKPKTTIRVQRRQITTMEEVIRQLREAIKAKDKRIDEADLDKMNCEQAMDEIYRLSEQINCLDSDIDRLTVEKRLAFLEGYYAKSQETAAILANGPAFPGNSPQTYARASQGDSRGAENGPQTAEGERHQPGAERPVSGLGGALRGQPPHDPAYQKERAVADVEVTAVRDAPSRFYKGAAETDWRA